MAYTPIPMPALPWKTFAITEFVDFKFTNSQFPNRSYTIYHAIVSRYELRDIYETRPHPSLFCRLFGMTKHFAIAVERKDLGTVEICRKRGSKWFYKETGEFLDDQSNEKILKLERVWEAANYPLT